LPAVEPVDARPHLDKAQAEYAEVTRDAEAESLEALKQVVESINDKGEEP
jgi:hypothetical protein